MADCNLFQFCVCLKLLGKLMVLIVLGFVGLTYYAVVIASYGPEVARGSIGNRLGSLLAVVSFTALVFMLVWSYFATVMTDPGGVPPGWHPFLDQESGLTRQEGGGHSDAGEAMVPRPRYCKKCQAWKPPRAHHCSVSGRCILKMDHYCIWVVNCVGLLNYKHFLLFLVYTCAACLEAAVLLVTPFVRFLQDAPRGSAVTPAIVFIAFVIDAAFFISLLGFLIMHARMVARNSTSIEMYEKAGLVPSYPYSKDWRENCREVFGSRSWRWLIPHYTSAERRQRLEQTLQTQAHELLAQAAESL